MPKYELAQLNIAYLKASLDSPVLADFVANLDHINELAENSPGFLWRLQTEEGDATALRPLGDSVLVNMSVWEDVAALHAYVYRSRHVEIMRRRREWFERPAEVYLTLWWVSAGYRPSVDEALERMELLRQNGPTADAFTFHSTFPPPDMPVSSKPRVFNDECPAT